MRNSSLLMLEMLWWATGIIAVAAAIRFAVTDGGVKTLIFLGMALVSFLFARMRRQQRKKS